MSARPLLVAGMALLLGCTGGRDRPRQDAAPEPPAPDASASKKRKKLKLPPPMEPPPRPEGEPGAPEDFEKLSEAAKSGQPVEKPGAPPVQRLDAFRARVGRVLVDRKARRLEIPAKVNMTKGILEYYAVASNGKLHESVLELHAEPSHVHLGLILLGLEPAKWGPMKPREPPKLVKPGGEMELFVQFEVDGQTRKLPATEWLYSRQLEGAPKPFSFMFQGSSFWNNRYGADMDRSVIALIPDSIAVVWANTDSGNPYRGANLGYEVHTAVIPPKGTPLTLIVQAVEAPEEKPAEEDPDAGVE